MSKKIHKSGFVSIIGRPNVGKSTLINALMEDKLSIITSKAQTTRHRIKGIINGDDYQIVISDTPGILAPNYQLQEAMMKFINETLIDSDVLVFIDEVGGKDFKNDSLIKKINKLQVPKLVLLNKIDLFNQEKLESSIKYWENIFPEIKIYEGYILSHNSYRTYIISYWKLIIYYREFSISFSNPIKQSQQIHTTSTKKHIYFSKCKWHRCFTRYNCYDYK